MNPEINQETEDRTKNPEKFNAQETVSLAYPFIRMVFDVYEIQNSGKALYFYGTPKADAERVMGELWTPFQKLGLEFTLKYELGEHVLMVAPAKEVREKIWVNLALLVATIFTTMISGAVMFGVDLVNEPMQFFRGFPFTLAIMAVLGSHEMAHYAAARYHGMRTSFPYFIPFPTFIGTMGAVIKYRGPIPSRKALFDVGIAGPLVGLVVSVAVTVIGLTLEAPQITPLPNVLMLDLGLPPLFMIIQKLVGATGESLHPVAFAGWVGMFVTLLNLLPAGQLDGGHVLRAMLGKKAATISSLMPRVLLVLGIYVSYGMKEDGAIWIFWALFLWVFAAAGHPSPLQDKIELDRKRVLVGVITFVLGLLCFTLVPFKAIG
ncbi:site-2 protease family protein [Methanosarcina sp. KYL-1]|uniref:site-2 protease family protein n=1 Tax=Methanosarcina sp. KYL-1 TaxID=2602068 RepID=UPI002101957B|nr:site-2 protease family protein [Methanosarcina sp. KYL-1]MCQ1534692.1 site-2 protease family protein [Methanosarcina sp. KYL-1]